MDSKLISSHCICRVCLIKVNIYIYQSLCKNFRGSWLAHKKVCRHNCLATVWPGCQKGTRRELQVQLLKQKGLGVVRGSTIYRMGTGQRTSSLCRAGVNSLLCCLLNSCSWFMCRISRSYCHTHTERHGERQREILTRTLCCIVPAFFKIINFLRHFHELLFITLTAYAAYAQRARLMSRFGSSQWLWYHIDLLFN